MTQTEWLDQVAADLESEFFPRRRPVRPPPIETSHPLTKEPPQMFSNRDQQEAHERACRAALATQAVRYAVAPGCRLHVPRGHLEPGDEVTLADLATATSDEPPAATMRTLIAQGKVLEQSEGGLRAANCPSDARFVVGAKALLTRRAILVPGEPISETDVPGGVEQLLYMAERKLVIDRQRAA